MRGTKRHYEQLQPQLQRDIVLDYRRDVRGHECIAIAQKHQLPVQSVIARGRAGRWRSSRAAWSQEEEAGSAEQARLYSSLDRNLFTTNQQLRARVGNKIAASTVSRYLARAKPPFTAKVAQDQEPQRTNRGLEGRGTEMVERSQDDCNAQTNLRRRSLPSTRMKLYTKVVLARASHHSRQVSLRDQVHAARLRKERSCGALGLVRQERRH